MKAKQLMNTLRVVCSLFVLSRSNEHSLCKEICYKLLAIPLRYLQNILLVKLELL